MSAHDHAAYVDDCFRCDLSRDETPVAHYAYLPPAVDFYCCGGCNAVTNDYVPWPCAFAPADAKRLT